MLGSLMMALVMGVVVAGIVRALMGDGGGGIAPTLIFGVIGAVLGRFLANAVFGGGMIFGVVFSILGASVAVAIYNAVAEG